MRKATQVELVEVHSARISHELKRIERIQFVARLPQIETDLDSHRDIDGSAIFHPGREQVFNH